MGDYKIEDFSDTVASGGNVYVRLELYQIEMTKRSGLLDKVEKLIAENERLKKMANG